MPFDFEYSVQVQKYVNGFKLHYIIPNKYFEGNPEEFETFLNKIREKKDELDFTPYKEIFNTTNIDEIISGLLRMKCIKLTPESYFLSVKHHIIQEFKQFNRIYYQLKGFNFKINGNDIYSQIAKKHIFDKTKSCLDELIKTYKSELEYDFKGLVNFDEYSEENKNLNKLHTNILLALNNHEKEYEGICFELSNLNENNSKNDESIENIIYYKLSNRVSVRIMKQERKENKEYEKRERNEKKERNMRNERKWRSKTNKPKRNGNQKPKNQRKFKEY